MFKFITKAIFGSGKLQLLTLLALLSFTFCSKEPERFVIKPITYTDVELHSDASRSEQLGIPFFAKYTSDGELFTGTQKVYYVESDSLHMELYYEDGFNTGSMMTKDGDIYLQKSTLYKDMPHLEEMYVNEVLVYKDIHPGENENGLGHLRGWHNNGQLSFEVEYTGDKKYEGLMTEYDEEGRITIQERYKDGEMVEKIK